MGLFRRKGDGIGPQDAAALLERGEAVLLDVREPDEWQAGHAPQAVHIPLGELGSRAGELPEAKQVIAVCRSGGRSSRAAGALRRAGRETLDLEGGMKAWHSAGLPLEPPGGRVA